MLFCRSSISLKNNDIKSYLEGLQLIQKSLNQGALDDTAVLWSDHERRRQKP